MKKIFKRGDRGHYLNAEHIEFHRLSLSISQKYSSVISDPPLLDDYSTAVAQELDIFKALRKSDFTEKKAEVDSKRDVVYNGIMGIVRINRKHFDPQMRDAANRVYNLMTSYGDVPELGYDSETVAVDSIVSRLHSDAYSPDVQALALVDWVNQLNGLNQEFKALVGDKTQETNAAPTLSQKAARKATDQALARISDRVESRINLGEVTDYADYEEEQNSLVKHYDTLVHEHYGRIHARIDIAPSVITPIETQTYTGKPVFVIPELRLRKVIDDGEEIFVDLIFSVDFSVSYRNNIKRGTATLIVDGIGKYKGELTTTFNIV